jgi:glycosyltransferase involved in cell wall biosynthesis
VWAGHRNDIAALLSAVDVVACPSHREPFSLVALEALAAGRPVVGTTVGGLPEVIVDGVTGLLVPPRDPKRLAAALVALLADPDRRRRLGQAAAAHAQEHFSAAQQVPRIESALARSASAGKQSSRPPWNASR